MRNDGDHGTARPGDPGDDRDGETSHESTQSDGVSGCGLETRCPDALDARNALEGRLPRRESLGRTVLRHRIRRRSRYH